MTEKTAQTNMTETAVTIEEVNRVLEVGRLMSSTLTPEDLKELLGLLYGEGLLDARFTSVNEISNTSVT